MISEQQQEVASLYVLGALSAAEKENFEADVRARPELQTLVRELGQTAELMARAVPQVKPPATLRDRIMRAAETSASSAAGAAPTPSTAAPPSTAGALPMVSDFANSAFFFVAANEAGGWKALPVPGAFIKLLSADRERGYAVLLGRLDRGVRYPAHRHQTGEDILILSGDLTVAGRRMGPGDFHHCDAGTEHPVNYSDEGCTLLAVLSLDHELTQFAMA